MTILKSTQRLHSQHGVALLTILIMVVLATILAASILKRQQASLDETRILLRQDQALMYAQSAEYFFAELLKQDQQDNQIDDLTESWAKPLPVFPVEDGFVSGQITDENAKFNLNSLLTDPNLQDTAAKQLFQAMLKRLNLDPELVEAVIDWQDANQETAGAMGAENSFYQGLQAGYLAPNQMFTSIEQLQLVRGFAGEPFQKLKPYITALPKRNTKININTADAFILSCLDESLEPMIISNALQQMRNNLQSFSNVSELWQLAPFSNVNMAKRDAFTNLLSVQSSFFTANITVNLSERERTMRSWLYRENKVVQSYQRSWVLSSQAQQSATQ